MARARPGPDRSTEDAQDPSPESAPTASPGPFAEFESLLADLGAEPMAPIPAQPAAASNGLDLKDVTIAQLREMLVALRPLAELLAQSEQRRLQVEAQLAARATETPRATERDPADSTSLRREIGRLKGHLTQARRALERAGERYEACQRLSVERWLELRSLRAERTRLLRELHALRESHG